MLISEFIARLGTTSASCATPRILNGSSALLPALDVVPFALRYTLFDTSFSTVTCFLSLSLNTVDVAAESMTMLGSCAVVLFRECFRSARCIRRYSCSFCFAVSLS